MKQIFRKNVFACLLVLGISTWVNAVSAQNKPPEKPGQNLQDFFQQLLSKKAVVGGTVLRGDNDTTNAGRQPFLLADEAVFKVLPGSSSMLLAWPSAPGDNWELIVAGEAVQAQGGLMKVQVPTLALQGLHPWELRKKGSNSVHMAGHWFFIQNIEASDGKQLLDLFRQAKGSTASSITPRDADADAGMRKVCDWMWAEKLVEFNAWCVESSAR